MNEMLISIIASLGLGGLIGSWFQSYLQSKESVRMMNRELLVHRYQSILVMMRCMVHPEHVQQFSIEDKELPRSGGEDTKEYSRQKLEEFYHNSMLYAPDSVLDLIEKFIKNPDDSRFRAVAKSMRKHLWR